ncbi:MAG TPA: hypothetical protein VGW58_09870 [Pyrinomonadaceae bacterium]|nr:hypothetical protein [Pyrinomonadaceae bacterium]
MELRLMSDVAFNEEFDVVVDQIAARYAAGQFAGEEKDRVERYFMRSPERQRKVKFMSELLHQMPTVTQEKPASGNVVEPPLRATVEHKARFWERVSGLWANWPAAGRAAVTFATIAIVAAGALFIRSMNVAPRIVSLELTMTSADRSVGSEIRKVSLPWGTDELLLKLKLPADAPRAWSYRATLRGEKLSPRTLPIIQDSDSLTTGVPAAELTPGTYFVYLFAINDRAEEQYRGAYVFKVE